MAATVVALLKKSTRRCSEKSLAGTTAESSAHVGTFTGLEQHDHDQGDAYNHMNDYQQYGHWLSSFKGVRIIDWECVISHCSMTNTAFSCLSCLNLDGLIVKKNQFAERFGVQAGPADQRTVDIGHLHERPNVVRFDAPSVKDANATGKRFSK
jgi:hypothetical protein